MGRPIARGEDWRVSEMVCHAGPQDRPFEERHERVSIAAVVEGSFQYRCGADKVLLYPGAFLLGNAGACFQCGHEHGTGDRCIAFHFAPWFFEEIAASVTGSSRFRFPTAVLPSMRELTLPLVELQAAVRGGNGVAMDEVAIHLAETVLATLSGEGGTRVMVSARDERRISNALRYIEAHAEEPLDLARLAAAAAMSKYHFLRAFRRTVGITPYRFLLGVRLRRAAVGLCTTELPVATLAYDAGFGDLSTFNARFREIFGASPVAFRRARQGAGRHSRR